MSGFPLKVILYAYFYKLFCIAFIQPEDFQVDFFIYQNALALDLDDLMRSFPESAKY